MTYRSDVDALAARTQSLATEVANKTKELESAQALLDEAVAKTKLPVLPNIKVATPCTADWGAMTGDERVRACASCNKNVYNLSSMTRDEAESLIMAKEGRLCVRYYQRKDGTILLKDCAIGIKQKRKRRVLAAGVLALLGGGVYAATRPPEHEEILGGIFAEPTEEATAAPSRPFSSHRSRSKLLDTWISMLGERLGCTSPIVILPVRRKRVRMSSRFGPMTSRSTGRPIARATCAA